jgi:predicted DNA-binding protein YlxM (UPF0122 family)
VEVIALLAKHDLTPTLERLLGQPDDDAHQPVVTTPRQQQRRLAPDQIATLLVMYVEGTSVQQLADEFSLHRTTVMEHLERNGIPRRPCLRQLTDEQVAQASECYSRGESLATVATHYSVSARTIAREFKRAGIDTRPQRGRSPLSEKASTPSTSR